MPILRNMMSGVKRTWRPKEVIPGVKHVVEGQPEVNLMRGGGKGRKKRFKQKLKKYHMENQLRSKVKPIVDPEEQTTMNRKRAARRRLRGKMGTVLTQMETLG